MSCIIGWAHTAFGRHVDRSVEDLIRTVSGEAIAHAGISAAAVDAIVLGTFNNGFSAQDFQASLVALADDALRFTPSVRAENACGTGSAAIHSALAMIEAKRARHVLVVGVEKMTDVATARAGDILLGASYRRQEANIAGGFAGVFAEIARAYFQAHGDQSDALARIAAKNHRNGAANPLAHMQRDLGFEFCNTVSDKNPYVAAPLRRTDCSMISDGAAALVLTDLPNALAAPRAIALRAAVQVNDFLPLSRRDRTFFEGGARAWSEALSRARLALDDLDFVETHDCFTIAELIEYEIMGLTPRGQGRRAIDEGWVEPGGKLSVNLSGGLKAKGHPVGATGVSQHVMAAMQLAGEAPGVALDGAALGGVFNMGGAAVANYVSVLERVR